MLENMTLVVVRSDTRAWGSPAMRHETLVLQRDVQRWSKRCRPILAIDFHAPGACESEGIYCFLPKPAIFPERQNAVLAWMDTIQNSLTPKYAAESFVRVADYPSRWETSTFASYCCVQEIDSFTIEIPYALIGEIVLTRECYREAGEWIAKCVVEKVRT